MDIKQNFRNYFFFYIIVILIFCAGVFSYHRFMIKQDYIVGYEGTCDPVSNTNKCFEGCDDDACAEKHYYSKMVKYASDLYKECGEDITDCESANSCLPGDHDCSVVYCNPEAKDLYLNWERPQQPLPKLKADITKVKEVVSNMIDNSIKYTQKGGTTVRVEVGRFYDHGQLENKNVVRVIVSDTGIGMEKEELESIFNKFERGKDISHYHTDGTGLGMFIAKKITEAHHGKIWAESVGRNKGSKFILELPVS